MPSRVIDARFPQDAVLVRALLEEYERSIGISLCFQSFEEELGGLPGRYAPPAGALMLASDESGPLGCVALRRLAPGVCEMKRLYVRPQARGRGLGRALVGAIIERARELGYGTMRLDTLTGMREAIALYLAAGFRPIGAYCSNPHEDAVFLELTL